MTYKKFFYGIISFIEAQNVSFQKFRVQPEGDSEYSGDPSDQQIHGAETPF